MVEDAHGGTLACSLSHIRLCHLVHTTTNVHIQCIMGACCTPLPPPVNYHKSEKEEKLQITNHSHGALSVYELRHTV